MNASTVITPENSRSRLGPLSKLTIAALGGIALVFVASGLITTGEIDTFTLVLAAIALALAGLVATGWRWAPAVAALICALLLFLGTAMVAPIVAQPHSVEFPPMVLLLSLAAAGLVGGVGATIQNYRKGERRMPRWLSYALVALFALALGAILLALVPQEATTAGVSPEVLAGLPGIETRDFAFTQKFLQVQAGETVAFRLENADGSAHTFTIDELGVNAPIAAGETGLALFQPTEPGVYTYYCAIPGHADLEARTGMIGTLAVVE